MLEEIIINKIKTKGPMSFHDFMEMALYFPGLGYYTSGREVIGTSGDYLTSPAITCLFGQMIAKQLEEMWILTGKGDFTIVEYGSGGGMLCNDIICQLRKNEIFYNNLHYFIIEKNDIKYGIERTERINSIKEIAPFNGCVLSNELLDNFPVHRVVMQEELMEVFVNHTGNAFTELLMPAGKMLKDYFSALGVELPGHYSAEVNLQVAEWIKDVSTSLLNGFVLTIDYGYLAGELYNEARRSGTFTCYHKHQQNRDPYCNIGTQDITAEVNFSALQQWGLVNGLNCCGFTSQPKFLHGLGFAGHVKKMEQEGKLNHLSAEERSYLLNTIFLGMGEKFKVMIQQKGAPRSFLSGMRFARPI